MSLVGGRRWVNLRTYARVFDRVRSIGVEGQSRLQIGGRTAAAGAIILKPVGNLTPPFRPDGQVSFGRSGNSARNRRAPEGAQWGVAKKANAGRIAINGAAMLTSFYHRSVLRCGRLAERKSGVADILSAARRREKICVDLSRIGYPRQPARANRNLLPARVCSAIIIDRIIDRHECGIYFALLV
jgi:hypothetical protein